MDSLCAKRSLSVRITIVFKEAIKVINAGNRTAAKFAE